MHEDLEIGRASSLAYERLHSDWNLLLDQRRFWAGFFGEEPQLANEQYAAALIVLLCRGLLHRLWNACFLPVYAFSLHQPPDAARLLLWLVCLCCGYIWPA